ncbi:DUF3536 domain-containing protein [bacterium]|nr:DUF3536 domain-containing protein [bacterium]
MKKDDIYLSIHGHFYQPPRENPWLEAIETQDSAAPYHDWNERINAECYAPNSSSRIVDGRNRIIDIVNNYEYMSFNFGPTLLSWMEHFAPLTYESIIKADVESVQEHSGHGNALAQVYNHIIMPLANENDKQTQVKWGIKDFEYRFGRKPEGMWLAETAADDDTLRVLAENGIKFTILSPYQACEYKEIKANKWEDASWGNIDPARPYRYFIKSAKGKYIDIFFYDGNISKSVAFDNLLLDGDRFAKRLTEGVSENRDFPQLINIATDGESYGHHTKFGDMALSYVLKVKAKDLGFKITNYAEFLEKFPPEYEVKIKEPSSWSCSHGVGRWCEDCGCSTGGKPGWNQKWRKPLREALNYLRDELITVFETYGKKYFSKDPWEVRNNYINVILNRKESNVLKFQKENFKTKLSDEDKVRAMELLEIQRQTQLMFTSCGWFFTEISGIETVQIMKYAARAMQLAKKFTEKDLEEEFLNILSKAKSNIPEMDNGKNIYENLVRPSIVTVKQLVCLWAISSLYEDFEDEEDVYCYKITRQAYKKIQRGSMSLAIGHLHIKSRITLEKKNIMFALVQYASGDFHCTMKEFSDETEYEKIRNILTKTFLTSPLTETIRALDEYFGKEYFTLKDIFMKERRKILNILLKGKLQRYRESYKQMYVDGRGTIFHLQALGMSIPEEFKIAASYTLSHKFNEIVKENHELFDESAMQVAKDIVAECKILDIKPDKTPSNTIYTKKIIKNLNRLAGSFEPQQANVIIDIFSEIDALELELDLKEAQNIYFNKIYKRIIDEINSEENSSDREFLLTLLNIGSRLNINTEFYKEKFNL